MEILKLVSMNVAGLNDKVKWRNIARYMTTLRTDIPGMQEMHLPKEDAGHIHKVNEKTKQKGVTIGIKPYVQRELSREIQDKEGAYYCPGCNGRRRYWFGKYLCPQHKMKIMFSKINSDIGNRNWGR